MTVRSDDYGLGLSTLNDVELSAVLPATTATDTSRVGEVMAEVFTRHHGAVLAYARSYCRDPQTAQDLAAEAYARTYMSVARGHGPRHAWRPYLMACVRRTAMEWSRHFTRRVLLPEDFETWVEHLAGDAETEAALLATEETALVTRAYRSLPERWQALLWLTVVEGEPAAAVAQRMGMTPSGVRSLAARAREGLREAYLREDVDEAAELACRYFIARRADAIRCPGRRRGPELARHLENCEGCARVAGEVDRANHCAVEAAPRRRLPRAPRPRGEAGARSGVGEEPSATRAADASGSTGSPSRSTTAAVPAQTV